MKQELYVAIYIGDRNREFGSGNLLHLWDDLDIDENQNSSYHHALIVDSAGTSFSDQIWQLIQSKMNLRILGEQKSPIYFKRHNESVSQPTPARVRVEGSGSWEAAYLPYIRKF